MSRQARVGLLVVAGLALFIVGLFTIANRSFLFSNTFHIRSQFDRVAGLRSGASVQYQGINVGRVQSVLLPAEPGGKITVRMAISQNAQHLLRENTQAWIKSDGLVGDEIIDLVSPPEVAEPVSEDDFIPGVDPFSLFEITDRAMASVRRFEDAAVAFEQIMLDVRAGEGTLGKIIYDSTLYYSFVQTSNETQNVLRSLGDNAQALVSLAEEATEGVQSILTKVEQGDGTVARFLNDPGVYNALLATSDTLQTIAADMRTVTVGAQNITNWGTLGAYRFAELMEAAKHNWLFKRYFEERGFMEQAPFEIRERAFEETYKQLATRQRELLEWEQRLKAREDALETTEGAPPSSPPSSGSSESINHQN